MKNDENHPTTIQHVGLLEGKRESGTGQLVGIYHFRSKRDKKHVSRSVEETEQTLSPVHDGPTSVSGWRRYTRAEHTF